MSQTMTTASRIKDRIDHSKGNAVAGASAVKAAMAGAAIGAMIGICVVAAAPLLAATGVVALAAASTATMIWGGITVTAAFTVSFSKIFEAMAQAQAGQPNPNGDIAEGSPDTFIGDPKLNAARAGDALNCHSGAKIATGAKTIGINLKPAAREKEETTCDGRIDVSCPTVFYGGPSARELPKMAGADLPAWFDVGRDVLDLVSTFGPGGALKLPARFVPKAFLLLEAAKLPGWVAKADKALDTTGKVLNAGETTLKYAPGIKDSALAAWMKPITDSAAYKAVTGGLGVIGGSFSAWKFGV